KAATTPRHTSLFTSRFVSFRRDFAGAFIRHGERSVAETCRAFVLAGIGCHADAGFWPAIGAAAATAANFNQMPIVRSLRKNTADSPRIWTKSASGSEPVFQALLVGCARMRQTTLKAGHAIPFTDGVLAYRHSGVAAERRISAHAEAHRERHRRHTGGEGHGHRYGVILRTAARRLHSGVANGGRDRTSGAGRRQDALRVLQRTRWLPRHRHGGERRGRESGPAAHRPASAAHAFPG